MNSSEQLALRWLNSWIEYLNQFEPGSLIDPSGVLIEELKRKYQRREVTEALDQINRLKDLGEQSNADERAEIRLWSSLALAEMNLFKPALLASRDAVRAYKQKHKLSVALWMKGCIEWVVQGQQGEAIASWRESIKLFEELRYSRRGDVNKYRWYDERIDQMQKALRSATSRSDIPPFSTDFLDGEVTQVEVLPPLLEAPGAEAPPDTADLVPEDDASHDPFPGDNAGMQDTDWLELFTVYEHIKAGDFGPSSILLDSAGTLEIDQVLINGRYYWIQSLSGSRFVRAIPSSEYTVIKVSGDSMNKAGIQDGDYVLLRLLPKNISDADLPGFDPDLDYPSEDPHSQVVKDGDIVAAEIFDEDAEIVLKRIYRRGKKVVLSPESTNPNYEEREFDGMNQGFMVAGVVVAVFKQR